MCTVTKSLYQGERDEWAELGAEIIEVNIAENSEVKDQYGLSSVPTFLYNEKLYFGVAGYHRLKAELEA
jgi:2-hydroxychromene-2-carboxylate isomerase